MFVRNPRTTRTVERKNTVADKLPDPLYLIRGIAMPFLFRSNNIFFMSMPRVWHSYCIKSSSFFL